MQVAIISKNNLFYERFIYLSNTSFLLNLSFSFFDVDNLDIASLKTYALVIFDDKSLHMRKEFLDKIQIYFSDEKNICSDKVLENIYVLYKYQSFKNIEKYFLKLLLDSSKLEELHYKSKSKLIYIYSPVSRCAKTTLATSIANDLSKKGKVLLISFDSCESVSCIKFSDFFYSYLKSDYNINFLKSILEEEANIYKIMGVYEYTDIYSLSENEYIDFLSALVYKNIFDYVIIDAGSINFNIKKVLDFSEIFVIPYIEELYSKKKIDLLRKEIDIKLLDEDKKKLKFIPFKETKNFIEDVSVVSMNVVNSIAGGE